MESWEGLNYYTANTNTKRWVELMNLSTAEWGLGPLPANVVAIPGRLNSSYNFTADTFIIEDAGKTEFGSSDNGSVVFGVTSMLVIIILVCMQVRHKTLLSPRRAVGGSPTEDLGPAGDSSIFSGNTVVNHVETGNQTCVTAEMFRHALMTKYYESVVTELEALDKDTTGDGGAAAPEDVEAVTDLLRKMYGLDLDVWSKPTTHDTEEETDAVREKSDAVLAEVRRLVSNWVHPQTFDRSNWNEEEKRYLYDILRVLEGIPERRYEYGLR